jgi:hypothetical protein
MKFILFAEGPTEHKAVPAFLKRWLDPRLSRPVGIDPVKFEGWRHLVKDAPIKARLHLKREDVIAVAALLDLYGPDFYPPNKTTPAERAAWAKAHLEGKVNDPGFFQFFAVHEVEAWLLSDPAIFPQEVRRSLEGKTQNPETINNQRPPSKWLNELYSNATRRNYKKVTYGKDLFDRLDPEIAYHKCPHLKEMLDKMLDLARHAGH